MLSFICLPPVVHSEGAAHKDPAQYTEQQAQDLSHSPPHPFSLVYRKAFTNELLRFQCVSTGLLWYS